MHLGERRFFNIDPLKSQCNKMENGKCRQWEGTLPYPASWAMNQAAHRTPRGICPPVPSTLYDICVTTFQDPGVYKSTHGCHRLNPWNKNRGWLSNVTLNEVSDPSVCARDKRTENTNMQISMMNFAYGTPRVGISHCAMKTFRKVYHPFTVFQTFPVWFYQQSMEVCACET